MNILSSLIRFPIYFLVNIVYWLFRRDVILFSIANRGYAIVTLMMMSSVALCFVIGGNGTNFWTISFGVWFFVIHLLVGYGMTSRDYARRLVNDTFHPIIRGLGYGHRLTH